ncbi:MAG: sugar ABC transporter permease [Clostridiales bacterium]|nr:sugar ABC transporter permease [Clostridiales bacterium]
MGVAFLKKRQGFRAFFYSQKAAPYVFVMPFILVFVIFFVFPLISTVIMSFQSVLPGQVRFIGLENIKRLNDPEFFQAIKNNLIYTALTLALLIPFPMIFACMLNSKATIGRNFFRSALFVPILTSVVVAGTIFRLIFGELPGALANQIVGLFGMGPFRWRQMQGTVYMILVMLACWRWTGVNILYFLSGLQSIPEELYESASIDGASTIRKFRHITWPMLKPTTIYVLTISIYGGFAMFLESYMLYTNNRSPRGMGLTIIGYLYRQGWEQNNIGYGSAIGLCLLLIVMVINLVQLKFFGLFAKEDK